MLVDYGWYFLLYDFLFLFSSMGMHSSYNILRHHFKEKDFTWLLFLPSMTGEHCDVLHVCLLHQENQLLIKGLD